MFSTVASRCLYSTSLWPAGLLTPHSIETQKVNWQHQPPPSQHSQPGALLHAAYHATLAKLRPSVVRNSSLQPRRRSGRPHQASRPKAVKHHPSILLENEGRIRKAKFISWFNIQIFSNSQIWMAFWPKGESFSFLDAIYNGNCALFTSAHGSRVRELVWPGTSSFWSELKGVFWRLPPELALKGPKVRSHATWRREIQCFYTMQAVLIVLPWLLDCLAKQQYVPSSSSIA